MNEEHTNSTDPWESEMSREFDKRVRDLHEAPLTFENVKGKAMTIRRNRRIAVAGGILAAAAVVVPVAVFAGNGLGDSDGNIDPADTPTVTQATDPNDPTPTETARPAGTIGASYLEGSTWHRADGSSVELDEDYFTGVELGDQLLASSNDEGSWTVDVIEPDGNVTDSFDVLTSPPVANADHTAIAYVATDGTVTIRGTDGASSLGGEFVDGDSVVGLTGDDCLGGGVECQAYVSHGDSSAPEVVASEGITGVAVPGAIKLNDVSATGLLAAQTSFSDTGSCSAVYDGVQGAEVFATCDATLFAFSPDAGYITGSSAYLDGIGLGYVTILDATSGTELARFTPKSGFVRESVWEDDDHVLVNTFEQGEWRIYRLGVDGSSEQVLSSPEGDDMTPAFALLGSS
ncbi:MAG: hypothetical protein M3237_16420 [Actinomycetota bacterium]|nr:hypothetical protein [Actinomycetota bacterium]